MNGGSGRSRDGVRRWKVLEHLGVCFPPPYEPHGGSVRWRGATRVKLSPEAEEYATAFARIEARDVALPPRFRSNFWGDWSRLLPAGGPITSLDGCSFAGLLSAASKKRAAPKEKRAADAEYWPAAQLRQPEAPAAAEYVPAAQSAQSAAPANECVPAGQVSHVNSEAGPPQAQSLAISKPGA